MPTAEEYIRKYIHNKNFYSFGITSGKGDFSDWQINALFYAALHLVQAVLAPLGVNNALSHSKRAQLMAEHSREFPEDVRSSYKKLHLLSNKARYSVDTITANEMRNAQNWLEELELEYRAYIERYTKTPETVR